MGKGRLLLSLGAAGQCRPLGPQLNVHLCRMPSWETLDSGRVGAVGLRCALTCKSTCWPGSPHLVLFGQYCFAAYIKIVTL